MDIAKEKFRHVGKDNEKGELITRKSDSFWKDVWRRLSGNKAAMFSLVFLVLLLIMAIVGPMMTPQSYNVNDLMNTNQSPGKEHWFGTDSLGRELWDRVWIGARVSIAIGFMAAIFQTIIGLIIGGIAGFYGGRLDMFIMRFIDVMISIPYLIFVILIMVIMGSGIVPIVIAIALTGWLEMARLVRGQIMQLKNEEFIISAVSLGAGSLRLIFKHLIPNTLGVVIVSLTVAIPNAIFAEAFLSFIGIGIKPPMTSWGQLADIGMQVMQVYPYQLLIPAVFISLTMLALQLFGDGLRDALDPKLRK
ncbi:ABC transporter permease [Oceanobacillus neutriphilus]|uniref:Diguanylate cyclase n=1 Tax=Oceanobacillus neutriphilus TaxID=531815 RepID=A0ABQ2NQG0_9BACI|nr:ABC transporter permease [Oceanobacillus neutriphilus]GGP07807.1 diguanylate cyclase [Oceanobacillus neutriphilus]